MPNTTNDFQNATLAKVEIKNKTFLIKEQAYSSCAVDNCDINGQIHDVLALKPYNLINMELLLTIPICLSS